MNKIKRPAIFVLLILPIIFSQSIAQGLFLEKGATGFILGREISKNSNANGSGFNFGFALNDNIDMGITIGKAIYSENNVIPYSQGTSIGPYLTIYLGKGDTAVPIPAKLFFSYENVTYYSPKISYISSSDKSTKLISLGMSAFKKISIRNLLIIPEASILYNISIQKYTVKYTVEPATNITNDPMKKIVTFSGIFDINFALILSPNIMFFIDPGMIIGREETFYNMSFGLILYSKK